jgi:hypothetical protein
MIKSYQEYKNECLEVAENRSQYLRKGQAIFNYVDEKYGVAREAQFTHKIDCYHLDENIEEFIKCTYSILQDLNDK